MREHTDVQTSTYEQAVISIMRRLPPEQVAQLVNFAYFLKFQTTQEHRKWLKEGSPKAGAEKWEELLARPEAKRVMRDMAREAREEYRAGRTTDIEITEEGTKTLLSAQAKASEDPVTLTEVVPVARALPALDKLKLIRILAEELESDKGIFPFESGKTYHLPTPYDSYGAADILAEAMVTYQEEND